MQQWVGGLRRCWLMSPKRSTVAPVPTTVLQETLVQSCISRILAHCRRVHQDYPHRWKRGGLRSSHRTRGAVCCRRRARLRSCWTLRSCSSCATVPCVAWPEGHFTSKHSNISWLLLQSAIWYFSQHTDDDTSFISTHRPRHVRSAASPWEHPDGCFHAQISHILGTAGTTDLGTKTNAPDVSIFLDWKWCHWERRSWLSCIFMSPFSYDEVWTENVIPTSIKQCTCEASAPLKNRLSGCLVKRETWLRNDQHISPLCTTMSLPAAFVHMEFFVIRNVSIKRTWRCKDRIVSIWVATSKVVALLQSLCWPQFLVLTLVVSSPDSYKLLCETLNYCTVKQLQHLVLSLCPPSVHTVQYVCHDWRFVWVWSTWWKRT